MAKVQCPECKEIITNAATKCFKCGASLRRERIKRYVERKHGDRLSYTKKKPQSDSLSGKKHNGLGMYWVAFLLLLLMLGGSVAAGVYFGWIQISL